MCTAARGGSRHRVRAAGGDKRGDAPPRCAEAVAPSVRVAADVLCGTPRAADAGQPCECGVKCVECTNGGRGLIM